MLEVGGIAFIAGLPSDPGSLEVTLVLTDQAGKSRTISVARANNPDSGTTDKDPWGYYGAARFSAEINVAELPSLADVPRTGTLSTWDVAVDLTVAGGTRRVPFQQRTYGQFMRTLLSERLLGDIFVTPEFPAEAGFRLVLRRAAVVAERVDISGRRIGLNLRQIDATRTFTKVIARMGGLTAQAAVITGPDGIGRTVIDLPVSAGQEIDFPQWTLRAVTDNGVERGLGWGLTASSAGCHVLAGGSPLVAAANAAGNLSVLDSEAFLLVESASLDQEGTSLILVVKTGDPASASRVHLNGKNSVRPTSVQPTPHGRFEIVLPVPGPGNYRLECVPDAGTAGSASVVRVGHSLACPQRIAGQHQCRDRVCRQDTAGVDFGSTP